MSERVQFLNGLWSFTWSWLRNPYGRAVNDLNNLVSLIKDNAKLGNGSSSWICNLESNGSYTSRSVAAKIDESLLSSSSSGQETMRNKLLPHKIGIFIWRSTKKRLPVRFELDKRGIDLDSLLCPMCGDDVETFDHIIYNCNHAKEIWDGVYRWWGKNRPPDISYDNLFKGSGFEGLTSKSKDIWQAVEWVTGYLIWKNRNQKVFHNNSWASSKIINEIQVKVYGWINNRSHAKVLDWQQWLLNQSNMGFPRVNNLDPG
ncbi:uncharacterized protein [Rutidosis leptorrhynchoides]|uniref:uncharacterized protein n=1 Tax=Rutidosis leptorrhynchoides TaxID=125765 RepID=UPI003A997B5B